MYQFLDLFLNDAFVFVCTVLAVVFIGGLTALHITDK